MKNNILLRALSEKDAPLMLEWLLDTEITDLLRFNTGDTSFNKALKFIQENRGENGVNTVNAHFAIADSLTDEYYGTVSLKNIDIFAKNAEYAIVLRKKAQGQGYGYAATRQVIEYAFYTLDLRRVYLNVLSGNETAVKFYERFGFILEGEFLEHIFVRDKLRSLKWFRLMRREYEGIKEALNE